MTRGDSPERSASHRGSGDDADDRQDHRVAVTLHPSGDVNTGEA